MSAEADEPRLHRERLLISIMYEGPWERVMNRLWALDPKTCELRREIQPGTLRDCLAQWAESRHHRWLDRYAAKGQNPPDRWKRRLAGRLEDEEDEAP